MLADPPKEHPSEDAVYKPDKACEDECSNHRCLKRQNGFQKKTNNKPEERE